ncbi:MAG TPA: hypothetical protein VMH86_17650 [Rhizomicrobium sp.]|nr:hypothetical protein [Rhizomicrobium sp.]
MVFVIDAAGVAMFFVVCWALNHFGGWRVRAAEILLPAALAACCHEFAGRFALAGQVRLAVFLFAAAAFWGLLRPLSNDGLYPLAILAIFPGDREGLTVAGYAFALSLGLALVVMAAAGVRFPPSPP